MNRPAFATDDVGRPEGKPPTPMAASRPWKPAPPRRYVFPRRAQKPVPANLARKSDIGCDRGFASKRGFEVNEPSRWIAGNDSRN